MLWEWIREKHAKWCSVPLLKKWTFHCKSRRVWLPTLQPTSDQFCRIADWVCDTDPALALCGNGVQKLVFAHLLRTITPKDRLTVRVSCLPLPGFSRVMIHHYPALATTFLIYPLLVMIACTDAHLQALGILPRMKYSHRFVFWLRVELTSDEPSEAETITEYCYA